MSAVISDLQRKASPRTYDPTELSYEVIGLGLGVIDSEPADLSQSYATFRYPNAGPRRPSESITRQQGQRASDIAERMFAGASNLLAA